MQKFRRATHTQEGKYLEKFREHNQTHFQKAVWNAHGDICHMLHSGKPLSYDEILSEIRSDTTNFDYHPADLEIWRDGSVLPTPQAVALSLVRLIEAGFVEVVENEDR